MALKRQAGDPTNVNEPTVALGNSTDPTPAVGNLATKAAAEAIREMAEARAITSPAAQRVDAGVVLMPETADIYDEAKGLLAGIDQQREAMVTQKIEADLATTLHYVRCRYNHLPKDGRARPQHGIYFVRNVGIDEFGPKDWFATYKKRGDETSRMNFQRPICQVCWSDGRVEELPVDIVDQNRGIMRCQERWIWSYNRETGAENRGVLRGAVLSANDQLVKV